VRICQKTKKQKEERTVVWVFGRENSGADKERQSLSLTVRADIQYVKKQKENAPWCGFLRAKIQVY